MMACLSYLSILQAEDKLKLITGNDSLLNLGGDPSFRGVWLPRLGADLVHIVCHVEEGVLF
jgi:hypothetical protein